VNYTTPKRNRARLRLSPFFLIRKMLAEHF
jgi:hypothetical protein